MSIGALGLSAFISDAGTHVVLLANAPDMVSCTVYRVSAGGTTAVRGAFEVATPGGVLAAGDYEAPQGVPLQYFAKGTDADGNTATSSLITAWSQARENLMVNSSFETGLDGWTPIGDGTTIAEAVAAGWTVQTPVTSGWTVAQGAGFEDLERVSTRAWAGTFAMALVLSSADNAGASSAPSRFLVAQDQPYTASVRVCVETGTVSDLELYLDWYADATSTTPLASVAAGLGAVETTWSQATVTGTAPPGAGYAALRIVKASQSAGLRVFIDGAIAERGAGGDYFDGSTQSAWWSGQPFGSTSILLLTAATIDRGGDYLFDLSTPLNGMLVRIVSLPSLAREPKAELVWVDGRPDPIVTTGVLRMPAGELAIATDTANARTRLLALISVGNLLAVSVRGPEYGFDDVVYFAITGPVVEARASLRGDEPSRLWRIPVQQVTPPLAQFTGPIFRAIADTVADGWTVMTPVQLGLTVTTALVA